MSKYVFYFRCSFTQDPGDLRIDVVDDLVRESTGNGIVTKGGRYVITSNGGVYPTLKAMKNAIKQGYRHGSDIHVCDDAGTLMRHHWFGFCYDSEDDSEDVAVTRARVADICTATYLDMLKHQRETIDDMTYKVKDAVAMVRRGEIPKGKI